MAWLIDRMNALGERRINPERIDCTFVVPNDTRTRDALREIVTRCREDGFLPTIVDVSDTVLVVDFAIPANTLLMHAEQIKTWSGDLSGFERRVLNEIELTPDELPTPGAAAALLKHIRASIASLDDLAGVVRAYTATERLVP